MAHTKTKPATAPEFGTQAHLDWFREALKVYTDKSTESPRAARDTLRREGIVNAKGNLKKNYS